MSRIKRRRLTEIEVSCHAGTFVGEYVPFYFCPRSIMLYLLHRGNHDDIEYRGGQRPIVHLELDLQEVVGWASEQGVRWVFTLGNAGAYACEFRDDLSAMDEINWEAVETRRWSDPDVKDAKAAEFLVHDVVPFELVNRIGVCSDDIAPRVAALVGAPPPNVETLRDWYY